MKSYILTHIADILTELYKEKGLLPHKSKIQFDSSSTFYFITYRSGQFYYGSLEQDEDGEYIEVDRNNPIPETEAIRLAWDYLDEHIKTILMADILGSHGK